MIHAGDSFLGAVGVAPSTRSGKLFPFIIPLRGATSGGCLTLLSFPGRAMKENKVLRTIYIPPRTDDKLTKMAKQMRISRNDLIEKCIILGMQLKRD